MINWQLRLKNKTTIMAIISAFVAFAYQLANALGMTLPIAQEQIMDAVSAILVVLAGVGVIVDPTTAGVSDSAQAMTYTEPKED